MERPRVRYRRRWAWNDPAWLLRTDREGRRRIKKAGGTRAWKPFSSSSPSTTSRSSWAGARRGGSRWKEVLSTESRSSSPKWVRPRRFHLFTHAKLIYVGLNCGNNTCKVILIGLQCTFGVFVMIFTQNVAHLLLNHLHSSKVNCWVFLLLQMHGKLQHWSSTLCRTRFKNSSSLIYFLCRENELMSKKHLNLKAQHSLNEWMHYLLSPCTAQSWTEIILLINDGVAADLLEP